MATTYTNPISLSGYADSANATGRIGRSAFTLFVDFAKVGAPAATGLVSTDIIDEIGTLPDNCAVRQVVAQVVRPITVLSTADGDPTAIPITLKAGSTTLASMTLADVNGPSLGGEWTEVSLATGGTGVDGAKETLSLTIGAVLDADSAATAITGGLLMLVFFVDYIPAPDELVAWFTTVGEVSDGGNAATEVSFDQPY